MISNYIPKNKGDRFFMRLHTLTILLLLMAAPANAQGMDEPQIRVRLLPGVTGAGDLPEVPGGLQWTLSEGWYTYWRTPGDSGQAPVFDWAGSQNVRDVKIFWPVPTRVEAMGMYSYVYDKNTLMPMTIIPENPGQPVVLSLNIQALVCKKICIPHQMSAKLTLPAGRAEPTTHQSAISIASESLPRAQESSDLRLDTAVMAKDALVFTAYSQTGFDGADIFIETPDISLSAPPQITPDPANPNTAIIRIPAPQGYDLTGELFGKQIKTTMVHQGIATEKDFSF